MWAAESEPAGTLEIQQQAYAEHTALYIALCCGPYRRAESWKPAAGLFGQITGCKTVRRFCVQEDQSLLQAFENCSRSALGSGPWMARFDAELIENLGRYRKYNQGSLRDLLRVIRNKHNHFRELPDSLQAKLGPLPGSFLR